MNISIRRSCGVMVGMLLCSAAFAQPQHAVPYPPIDDATGYKVVRGWPMEKLPDGAWGAMSSVAVGPDGNVWTFNRGKVPVQVFTPDGRLVKSWGEGMFKNPHTIRF